MKRKSFVTIFILCLMLTVNCLAVNSSNIYEYTDEQITVVFAENSAFSSDEQAHIADHLVYGTDAGSSSVQPRAWCWLTGHDLVTENVSVISHKVYDTPPRCVREVYLVETCSNCDHEEMTRISEENIYCCDAE